MEIGVEEYNSEPLALQLLLRPRSDPGAFLPLHKGPGEQLLPPGTASTHGAPWRAPPLYSYCQVGGKLCNSPFLPVPKDAGQGLLWPKGLYYQPL